MADYILWFDQLGMHDVNIVGGKNASLGEMISNLANVGVSRTQRLRYHHTCLPRFYTR